MERVLGKSTEMGGGLSDGIETEKNRFFQEPKRMIIDF